MSLSEVDIAFDESLEDWIYKCLDSLHKRNIYPKKLYVSNKLYAMLFKELRDHYLFSAYISRTIPLQYARTIQCAGLEIVPHGEIEPRWE